MLKHAKTDPHRLPQTGSAAPADADDPEYAALHATLESSEIGRRFLADYARQHTAQGVRLPRDAAAKHGLWSSQPEDKLTSLSLVSELVAMSETIGEMRREIGDLGLIAQHDPDQQAAACAFAQIVTASAHATSDVLIALEELQNVSWAMRDKGAAAEDCDSLDESATEIYTACARQEIA
ncbi:MAG: hypothetical protein AAF405_10420, partial [Pseudomonadota bacterium]